MALEQIAGPAHYVRGRVNIGVIVGDGKAALIDSGLDESAARKAAQAVEQAGLRAVALINTHAHADHCGGNAFLKKRTGATVYAPAIEAALIQHTEIEPLYLFGAAPFPAIDSKWFHAAPSQVDHVLGPTLSLCGLELTIFPAAGHSINQVGVLTPDVAFLGDALVTPELLERYPIQYCYDVPAHRATLERAGKPATNVVRRRPLSADPGPGRPPRSQSAKSGTDRRGRPQHPLLDRHHRGRHRPRRGGSRRSGHGPVRLSPERGGNQGAPFRPRARRPGGIRDPDAVVQCGGALRSAAQPRTRRAARAPKYARPRRAPQALRVAVSKPG